MRASRLALTLLAYAESCGFRDEVIGDLFEEMALGRSNGWLCRQLLSLGGLTVASRVRERACTRCGIACLLASAALAAVLLVPAGRLIQAWLVVYSVSGTLSLFAHMVSADAELPDEPHDE